MGAVAGGLNTASGIAQIVDVAHDGIQEGEGKELASGICDTISGVAGIVGGVAAATGVGAPVAAVCFGVAAVAEVVKFGFNLFG